MCDPIVTHGPYLSALEMLHYKALFKFTFALLLYFLSKSIGYHWENSQIHSSYIPYTGGNGTCVKDLVVEGKNVQRKPNFWM